MPVKKKAVKTEEISTETQTITEKVENIDIPEEDLNIQKPKKPKRELTEKQKLNFAKLQEANKLRYAEKKKLKEEALNNKITEVEIKKEDKPTSKPIDIPQEQPTPEPMIDITPVEEKKEEIPLNKKYSAKQILQSLGL